MLDSLDALIAFVTVLLALSLLVTTLVQIVLNLLNLRGRELQRGLCEMFEQMPLPDGVRASVQKTEEEWAKLCKRISFQLVKLPAAGGGESFKLTKRTAAIDLDLIPLLLSDLKGVLDEDEKEFAGIGKVAAAIQKQIQSELEAGIIDARQVVGRFPGVALAKAKMKSKEEEVELIRFLRQGKDRATARFDSFMRSAGERFRQRAHLIGFFVAVVLCCYLRVDSFRILSEFYAQPEAARVYAETQSKGLLAQETSASVSLGRQKFNMELPERLKEAWRKEDPDRALPQTFAVEPSPQAAATWMRPEWEHHYLSERLMSPQQRRELSLALDQVYAERRQELEQQRTELQEVLGVAPVQVMAPASSAQAWWDSASMNAILGWLFSAFLVALGAPFWFNALRQLTSLRSSVATALDPPKQTKPAKQSTSG